MNYNAQVLSNYFRVKDTKLVKRLLGSAGFFTNEDDGAICFYDNEDSAYLCDMNLIYYNDIPIAVTADYNDDDDIYRAIEEYAEVKEDDIDDNLITIKDFYDFLSDQLLEGEAVKVTEVGHEGLRYQSGCGVVVTKKGYQWFDLKQLMDNYAKENV